jgi:predicted RNA methylase
MSVSTLELGSAYEVIYDALGELRETFHRSGRLDDSNAKLDEVAKLFATYLAHKRGQIEAFPSPESASLIGELQAAFEQTAVLPSYCLKQGGSVFGPTPSLVLRPGDEELAGELVRLVKHCVDAAFQMRGQSKPFDILNEAFGHFIRDNFRGNVEDAQYMTPPEVVDFAVDLALEDIVPEFSGDKNSQKFLTVVDPTCGVGSFLTAFYNRVRESGVINPARIKLVGQDKVERMVRLSTINMELFDVGEHHIYAGNSLERGSELDALNGEVDLILTNPPFGARFDAKEVTEKCGDNTPFFSSLKRQSTSLDSELLFVDRHMRLLRDGGRLFVVVPDGVISARGLAAQLRRHMAANANVVAVIELPAMTFAQAGTGTKTALLYIQRGRRRESSSVFMASVKDLGFQVSSRKGVRIKVPAGRNELPDVLRAYATPTRIASESLPAVLSRTPSCVLVEESQVLRGGWTPNHYSALRYETLSKFSEKQDFELVPLKDLVSFCGDTRRAESWSEGAAFISVLHILGDGFIDLSGALNHAPKTPGIAAHAGEVLISRINPRIPRVCVTPDLQRRTLCSAEFEVMKCNNGVSPYSIAYLLQTEVVQNQIRSLTSGTSASHNRIRTRELSEVLIPIARPGSKAAAQLLDIFAEYESASIALVSSTIQLAALRSRDSALFGLEASTVA